MSTAENAGRRIDGFLSGLFQGARYGAAIGATLGLGVGITLAILGTGGAVVPLLLAGIGIGAVSGGGVSGILGSLLGVFKSAKESEPVDPVDSPATSSPVPTPVPSAAPALPIETQLQGHQHDHGHCHKPENAAEVAAPSAHVPTAAGLSECTDESCTKHQDQVTASRAQEAAQLPQR